MKTIRTLIVDDEEESRKLLRIYLEENHPELEIIGEASSALQAIKEINKLGPDVVFLDIQMPNGTGFDVLDAIPSRKFEVVFLTAHSDYAIQAVREKACDYLVKPLDLIDLGESVERIKTAVLAKRENRTRKGVLAIPTREGLILLNLSDIIRLEGDGSYATIFKTDGGKIIASQNLKNLSQFLDDSFIRVHNSHIISIEHAVKLLKDDGIICMKDGTEVPLSRRKKKEFLDLFKSI